MSSNNQNKLNPNLIIIVGIVAVLISIVAIVAITSTDQQIDNQTIEPIKQNREFFETQQLLINMTSLIDDTLKICTDQSIMLEKGYGTAENILQQLVEYENQIEKDEYYLFEKLEKLQDTDFSGLSENEANTIDRMVDTIIDKLIAYDVCIINLKQQL